MKRYSKRVTPIVLLLCIFLLVLVASSPVFSKTTEDPEVLYQNANMFWQDVDENQIQAAGLTSQQVIVPDVYRTLTLDTEAFVKYIAEAPLENSASAQAAALPISLPLPDGSYGRFLVVESPIMEPELAAKFPQIKTYLGQGVDDPTATIRFDWTPHGFHAMILSAGETVYIDPHSQGNTSYYISYNKHDYKDFRTESFIKHPPVDDSNMAKQIESLVANNPVSVVGQQLRTYRLAVAATGEYTQFHGGTVSGAMAEVVTAINRVTGIYERDMAVRLVLIGNNDSIIYTNASTDPYTNNNGGTMLGQNQSNLDSVIGSSNYDIGHVFSTGGGGVAYLGAVCRSNKAGGVTGLGSPVGDPFYVDYVAHEMGHQFGANHTFNGTAGSCGGGNRNSSTAYEPGSGSTIMAYAGICSTHNIATQSDDHFHTASFDEIIAYTQSGSGNSCASISNTGNNPPTVNAGTGGVTIPRDTPFTLTGSGSDPNGDTLTYMWEQFDLGSGGDPDTPSGNAPLFRSFPATSAPVRTFPQWSDIVNNTQTTGEILPSYGRNLSFRLTARDNKVSPSAGGVANDSVSFSVSGSAGPFAVTAPNTSVSWTGGTSQTVSWNVAGTNSSPVSCANVDIHLSTDGGFTYPTLLLSSTANDGSANVTVPNINTTSARVQVACALNSTITFFDISNANFTIVAGGPTSTPTNTTIPPTATATGTSTTVPPTATATSTTIPGTCTTYTSSNVPISLPNGTTSINSNLSVAGSGTIDDVNVSVDMPHAWPGDLSFTLTHQDTGTAVTIIDRPGVPASTWGCSTDDIDVTLDDEAGTAVENQCAGSPPAISGTHSPNNPLSAFDGENGNGTWVLTVADAYTSGDAGTLNGWSVEICTVGVVPTATSTSVPPTATNTPIPPTPTNTAIPPTATNTPTPDPGGTVFFDDFESNQGWTVNPNGTDNATTGQWERANPEQTTYSGTTYQQGTTTSGSFDLVTGGLAGSSVGSYDIDGGTTSIRSPNITLPSSGNLTLSFDYYLSHYSNASSADFLRISVVGNTTTVVFEELAAADIDAATWSSTSASLNSFAGQTVYILIEAADGGGGSLVEAAIDDVEITSN